MKLLISYIKQYRLQILLYFVFFLIFTLVFYLYNQSLEPVLYAFLLCALVGVLAVIFHFIFFYRRFRAFKIVLKNPTLTLDRLPSPKTPSEEEYVKIIKSLDELRLHEGYIMSSARSEAYDYFTTWVHQIKAPIAAMRLMLQSNDTEENRELLSELFRIEQYTEMVLTYFRLNSDTSDFVFTELPLDSVIRKAIRRFAPLFVRKRIGINYSGTDCTVLTDEKWLSFILEQLLSNAVKYTDKGSVNISVDESKCLYVSDTGIGIAPEDLPRIFEKGFTGYNGRGDKKSTGLGLYLCKKAADRISAKLTVTSAVGQGSRFCLDLNTDELHTE